MNITQENYELNSREIILESSESLRNREGKLDEEPLIREIIVKNT